MHTLKQIIRAFLPLLCMGLLLTACQQRTVYHTYRETPIEGWEQNDTILFHVDSIRHPGVYHMSIGLRTTAAYAYRTLWLLVESHWQNPGLRTRDTLVCHLTNNDGDLNGRGIDTYQYTYPLAPIRLRSGQTGTISVRHIMRRDILPGVSDIGVEITRAPTP